MFVQIYQIKCREAWKEKFNYLAIYRLEDKEKYEICKETSD